MLLQVSLIGSGGHASVVKDALQKQGFQITWIFDENPDLEGKADPTFPNRSIQWLGPDITQLPSQGFLAIGDNQARFRLATHLKTKWVQQAIHPTALVHPTAQVGEGVYIGAYSVIQPGVVIGDHVIVNTGAIVEHDCRVGAYVHLAPRVTLAGHTVIEEGCLMGVGSISIPGITVGAWSVVGAGSVILKDIPPGSKAFGVPCKLDIS